MVETCNVAVVVDADVNVLVVVICPREFLFLFLCAVEAKWRLMTKAAVA